MTWMGHRAHRTGRRKASKFDDSGFAAEISITLGVPILLAGGVLGTLFSSCSDSSDRVITSQIAHDNNEAVVAVANPVVLKNPQEVEIFKYIDSSIKGNQPEFLSLDMK